MPREIKKELAIIGVGRLGSGDNPVKAKIPGLEVTLRNFCPDKLFMAVIYEVMESPELLKGENQ